MEFQGCTAVKCVRQSTGKKEYYQYQIEETCNFAQNGNNTCPFKRHEKIERTENVREPAGT